MLQHFRGRHTPSARRWGALTALAMAATIAPAVPAAAADTDPTLPGYQVVYIGTRHTPHDGVSGEAMGPAGHVVGQVHTWETQRAFLWDRGIMIDRGDVGQQNAVNKHGHSVGFTRNPSTWRNQAYVLDGSGGHWLPPLPGASDADSDGLDINDAGDVVGTAEDADYDEHPVIWPKGDDPVILPKIPGQDWGIATSINNSGEIVGLVRSDTYYGTVIWRGSSYEMELLPDLGMPMGINDNGVVLSDAVIGGTWAGYVRRYRDGRIEKLEGLTPTSYVTARYINNAGDVTGDADNQGVLWPAGSTKPVTLNSLVGGGHNLTYSRGVAEDGSILAYDGNDTVVLKPGEVPPAISNVSFEQKAVPTGEWVPVPDAGTIDGNHVRVKATLTNRGPVEKDVRVIVQHGDKVLTRVPLSETVPAKGSVDVTVEWDSTGEAWDDGKPAGQETFSVRLFDGGKEVGEKEAELVVRPRPLVLVHGFNADASTWDAYPALVSGVRADWPVYAVGDGKAPGVMNTGSLTKPTLIPNTIVDNAQIMAAYIAGMRAELDAENIDIVAHSMGGLISREYIETAMGRDSDGDNVVTRLVMLGTPNHGSRCAELLSLAGMYELRPEVVAEYNQRNVNKPGVPMSVLSGKPVPFTCDEPGQGDGVVSVPSAITGYPEHAHNYRVHTALTKGEDWNEFVLPRLVGSPFTASTGRFAAAEAPESDAPQLLASTTLEVGKGGSVELPVAVGAAKAIGVTYVAPAGVRAVIERAGVKVAASPEGESDPIRTLRVDDPQSGAHVLRLTATDATVVPVSVWVSGSPVQLDASAQADSAGRVVVKASLVGADSLAAVRAVLTPVDGGAAVSVPLAAGESGSYEGRSARLKAGSYYVSVTATFDGQSRTTLTTADVGEATEVIDTDAPTVSATRPQPTGADGWDTGAVTVELKADDGAGSGVREVRYTIGSNGEQVVPGASASVDVTAQGVTTVTYRAVDHAGNESTPQSLTIRIDSAVPTASCTTNAPKLWPPNHKMVAIEVACSVNDAGSGGVTRTLVSVTSNEPDDAPGGGDGSTKGDSTEWVIGSDDLRGQLRAERDENGKGRTYTLTYRVRDAAGNATSVPVTVSVPVR